MTKDDRNDIELITNYYQNAATKLLELTQEEKRGRFKAIAGFADFKPVNPVDKAVREDTKKQILARAIKSLEFVIQGLGSGFEGTDKAKNDMQLLLLVNRSKNAAKLHNAQAVVCGLVVATTIVLAFALAAPTHGFSLLLLISVLHMGMTTGYFSDKAQDASDRAKEITELKTQSKELLRHLTLAERDEEETDKNKPFSSN